MATIVRNNKTACKGIAWLGHPQLAGGRNLTPMITIDMLITTNHIHIMFINFFICLKV